MKVFIDTNILIDLIADRKPFSKWAIEIFKKSENKELKLFASSHSIATTHYLMKKFISENELREILNNLLDYLIIIPVDISILKRSLKSSITDFEDAIQNYCASSVDDIYGIITRNKKDFKKSELEIYTPDEFINKIK